MDKNTLTDDQKISLYNRGAYSFPPPPVYHGFWDRSAWIKFIDLHGKWHK